MTHNCNKCGVKLDTDNWAPSFQKRGARMCKECSKENTIAWQKDNPDKLKLQWERAHRKNGGLPFYENKECSQYFGIHIVESVLMDVFNDVIRMPVNTPGYDLICNKGKKIDAKSACMINIGSRWIFHIRCNTIADYFACVAFDNRVDLNPLYIWMLPGNKFNYLQSASISQSTIYKWDEYEHVIDINKVVSFCDAMKGY